MKKTKTRRPRNCFLPGKSQALTLLLHRLHVAVLFRRVPGRSPERHRGDSLSLSALKIKFLCLLVKLDLWQTGWPTMECNQRSWFTQDWFGCCWLFLDYFGHQESIKSQSSSPNDVSTHWCEVKVRLQVLYDFVKSRLPVVQVQMWTDSTSVHFSSPSLQLDQASGFTSTPAAISLQLWRDINSFLP